MAKGSRQPRRTALNILLNVIGLGVVLFLVLRAPYGFGTTDECYYLNTAMRLVKGDALLVDEWFIAQLFSFITYPILRIYLLIAGSTEGIILAFRYIYIAAKTLSCVFIYRRLAKTTGEVFAFIPTILFLIFTPFDLMALSYNTIGLMCFAMVGAGLSALKESEKVLPFWLGVLTAFAVLSSPYMITGFLIYTVCVFVLCKSSLNRKYAALRIRTWLKITAGAAIVAAAFAAFVLSRATLQEVIASIPHLFSSPSHQLTGRGLGYVFEQTFCWSKKRALIWAFVVVISILAALIKPIRKLRTIIFLVCAVLAVVYVLIPGYPVDLVNYAVFPINMLGLVCFAMSDKKKWGVFFSLWVLGFVYAFSMVLSSNQGFIALSYASCISAMGSIIFMTDIACEMWENAHTGRIVISIATGFIILAQLGFVAYSAATRCLWDDPSYTLTEEITHGCEKGVITSSKYADLYDTLFEETAAIREATDGRVLYFSLEYLWLILDDEKMLGTPLSYYERGEEYLSGEILAYWEMFPEKKADYYYFDSCWDVDIICRVLGIDRNLLKATGSGNWLYMPEG